MNKLSKLIYLTSLMSLCALSAASCSAKQADIDISSLSSEFNESGIFSETLSDISQPIMEKRYGIEEGQIAEFKAGAGTKAVVDEYAIIKLSSPDAKENVENGIKSHKVCYSKQDKLSVKGLGSVVWHPTACACVIVSEVINELIKES